MICFIFTTVITLSIIFELFCDIVTFNEYFHTVYLTPEIAH